MTVIIDFLLSVLKQCGAIVGWDLRNPGHALHTMEREVNTNQRIYFDSMRYSINVKNK